MKSNRKRLIHVVGNDYPVISHELFALNGLQSCFKENYDPQKNTCVDVGNKGGMNVVAFLAVEAMLMKGKRAILVAPTRSLLEEIYDDMVRVHGKAAIGFGMVQEMAEDKKVILATAETYTTASLAEKKWTDAALVIICQAQAFTNHDISDYIVKIVAWCIKKDSRVLVLSSNMPNVQDMAAIYDADLFIVTE